MIKNNFKGLGMVAQAYNTNTWRANSGTQTVWGQPEIESMSLSRTSINVPSVRLESHSEGVQNKVTL